MARLERLKTRWDAEVEPILILIPLGAPNIAIRSLAEQRGAAPSGHYKCFGLPRRPFNGSDEDYESCPYLPGVRRNKNMSRHQKRSHLVL